MAIRYPGDGTMLVLIALYVGERLTAIDGHLLLSIEGLTCGFVRVSADALDELEARGWLTCDTDPASITERGRYWCEKWITARKGAGRFMRMKTRAA